MDIQLLFKHINFMFRIAYWSCGDIKATSIMSYFGVCILIIAEPKFILCLS